MRQNLDRHIPADAAPLSDSQVNSQNLAAQVSDIAQRIFRLHQIVGNESEIQVPVVDAEMLRQMLMARRARVRFFTDGLFADPAWDILLDLLMSQLDGKRVTVTNLCVASNVPATTALRWIKTLEVDGLVSRRADPLDARRFFIQLTKKAEDALRNYFSAIGVEFVI